MGRRRRRAAEASCVAARSEEAMLENVTNRPETVDDFPAVREVVNLAFQNDD